MDSMKLKWMSKLAKTRSFILMTDKEAIVSIKSAKGSFKNVMLLASYKTELQVFKEKIDEAIKQVDEKMGVKKPVKKAKKITVK